MAASIQLKVLELYSGIGGMHWALEESGIDYEVVLAVDINTTANKIYRHNFPIVNLLSFGLEKLTLKKLESLNVDAILMSPLCQPFTRVGKKGDCDDVRTKSFLHLLDLIKQAKKKPTYILVENVKGFETSHTRELLLECLACCGYVYQEFLLTPLQFNVPNCRLRYYLVAKCRGSLNFNTSSQVLTEMPTVCNMDKVIGNHENRNTDALQTIDSHSSSKTPPVLTSSNEHSLSHNPQERAREENVAVTVAENEPFSDPSPKRFKHDQDEAKDPTEDTDVENVQLRDVGRNMRYCEEDDKLITKHSKPLSSFMETLREEDVDQYQLTDKELRFFVVMDVVFPALKKSICFTKRYGHYVEGAGSVVQMCTDVQTTKEASEFKSQAVEQQNSHEWQEKEFSLLRRLRLRYFTPQEVANLLCFPSSFTFPEDVSKIQKYRVLGNSLNVHVVSQLIKLMVS